MDIKFVKYTGEFPNLCSGELTLLIDGKETTFGDFDSDYDSFWRTGGCVGFTDDWSNSYVQSGEWELDDDELPGFLREYGNTLIDIFNENVPDGCCGGCI